MHVTNTALHLDHPALRISDDDTRDDDGAIWSLSAVLRRMELEGFVRETVFEEISELVSWFLRHVAREGLFARQAALGPARAFGPKLIGFDILLGADGHPWLIEMQSNPAARGSALVNRINGEMFTTMHRMQVGVFAEDGISATDLDALRSDPREILAAERALEIRHKGRFRPL